jgi:hypothetical protein
MMPVILNIETDYIASVWVKTAQGMGSGTRNIITVISVAVLLLLLLLLLLLCLMLKFSYVIFGVGNNVNKETLCWLQIEDSVMCVQSNYYYYYYYYYYHHHHHQGMALRKRK